MRTLLVGVRELEEEDELFLLVLDIWAVVEGVVFWAGRESSL